jgi:hypothetical protein
LAIKKWLKINNMTNKLGFQTDCINDSSTGVSLFAYF